MPDRGAVPDISTVVAELDERVRRLERRIQIKAARTITPIVVPGATVDVDVVWPTAFIDRGYTVAVTVSEGSGSFRMLIVVAHEPDLITCRLQNVGAADAIGTVHAIGIHD